MQQKYVTCQEITIRLAAALLLRFEMYCSYQLSCLDNLEIPVSHNWWWWQCVYHLSAYNNKVHHPHSLQLQSSTLPSPLSMESSHHDRHSILIQKRDNVDNSIMISEPRPRLMCYQQAPKLEWSVSSGSITGGLGHWCRQWICISLTWDVAAEVLRHMLCWRNLSRSIKKGYASSHCTSLLFVVLYCVPHQLSIFNVSKKEHHGVG